ncbi:MAG: hypothetical protein ABIS37_02055 [Bacteroidia bacterium]
MLLFFAFESYAQTVTSARQHFITVKTDSVIIDTVSIIPGTFFILNDSGNFVDSTAYAIDYPNAVLRWKKDSSASQQIKTDSVKIVYRVFPVLFTQSFTHREKKIIEKNYQGLYNPFQYKEGGQKSEIFKLEGLTKNGSISRGVSFGNNQDLVVNSSLNLQLAGKLNDDVDILAAITDNNIPVQPEGNTQQLNDFDKVFIQLSKNKSKLIAGDFELTRPESYFMNFNKKGQGGVFSTEFPLTKTGAINPSVMRTALSASVSKGKFARNVFNGIEANQGPYRLIGAQNEAFITVLSGSEKIYIDGQLLTRGQEYDYVIDYNAAQITFTTRQLITKDKRIVAEFQYSDKNYGRSLIYFNNEFENRKLKLKFNVYSEQDSKNQPLLQDLSDEQKLFLADIGDSITRAFSPNVDSIAFDINEVLYQKKDTIDNAITYNIYFYSTDSTVAHYRLGFSFVGQNVGNYIQILSSANGRVFQWVVPLNGVPQGAYEPVTLLITPKQQQMVTFGTDYKISNTSIATIEGALSNYDINRFATKDKKNDVGYAVNTGIQKMFSLDADSLKGWKFNTAVKYEHVDKNFVPVETFRPVEFNRDWNLTNLSISENENGGVVLLGLNKMNQQVLNYQLKTFLKGNQYHGLINALNGLFSYKTYRFVFDASYLQTSGTLSHTNFLRSHSDFSKTVFKKIITGVRFEQEQNKLFDINADTLQWNSYSYKQGQYYIVSSDTVKTKYKADYSRRYDYAGRNNSFKNSTVADNTSAAVEFNKNPNNRLGTSLTYRNLRIIDTLITSQKKEKSILAKIDYNLSLYKGVIVSTTYYEAGIGQEPKLEFSYVKVEDGTGVYTFNDYNDDGIPQLNEFEIAAFKDQANYIRVFTPTNAFVSTHTNQLNQVFNFNPSAILRQDKKFSKFMSRFADQFSMRLDNKTLESNLLKSLNPFLGNVADTSLISTNSSFRNTFFYNRNSNIYGFDVTYEDQRGKTLLTNGFDARVTKKINGNARWNINRTYSINEFGENGQKKSTSDFFSEQNYFIKYYSSESKFNIQPGSSFRASLIYEYKYKRNFVGGLGERAIQNKFGTELRYSSVKRGVISVKVNFIQLNYNAEENTSIAYEMLEGLKKGNNATWSVSIERNISGNVQLSLNYEGRKSQDVKTVHTGNMQVRAFF